MAKKVSRTTFTTRGRIAGLVRDEAPAGTGQNRTTRSANRDDPQGNVDDAIFHRARLVLGENVKRAGSLDDGSLAPPRRLRPGSTRPGLSRTPARSRRAARGSAGPCGLVTEPRKARCPFPDRISAMVYRKPMRRSRGSNRPRAQEA